MQQSQIQNISQPKHETIEQLKMELLVKPEDKTPAERPPYLKDARTVLKNANAMEHYIGTDRCASCVLYVQAWLYKIWQLWRGGKLETHLLFKKKLIPSCVAT